MRKLFNTLSAAFLLTLLTGCLQMEILVKVKPDGSGTVEQKVMMSAKAVQMALMGKQQQGGAGEDAPTVLDLFPEDGLKAQAKDMGEGVTYVSHEKVEAEGFQGVKTIYAFTDINKLKIDPSSSMDSKGGPQQGKKESRPITFKLSKAGGNSLLTVVFPADNKKGEGEGSKTAEKPKLTPEQLKMQADMAKQMLKGLKVGVLVEVEGTLVKTNTEHVEGNKVTLFEIPFDKVMEDDKAFKKMMAGGKDMNFEQKKELFKDVEGVKFSPEKEVTIEFK